MNKKSFDQLEERKHRRNTTSRIGVENDSDEQCDSDVDGPSAIRLRRKSFYTKSYNPEEDLDEQEIKFFPKTDEVKTKLESSIRDNVLFKALEPEQLTTLIDAMSELSVTAGDELIRRGDDNYGFYVIGSGEYEISGSDPRRVTSGIFGELTLLHNQPSGSTITALTDGKVYSLHRNDFRKIVTKTTHEIRKTLEELINHVPLLKDLSEIDKLKVADVLELINFSDGDTIINEGENANGMYLVVRGSVRLAEKDDGASKDIRIVKTGDYFGELPLSKPTRGCIAAYAIGPTKVALLKAQAFERLMGPCLKVLKKNPSNSRKPLQSTEKPSENA